MLRRIWKTYAAVVLGSVLLMSSCICSTGVNRGDINLISVEEEWRMGDQLAAELAQQLQLVEDPAVQRYVEQIGEQLVAETELADRPWQFHVVADPTVNAFAIPGGHVYVHTGLIAAADSVGELAGVMAHEVAHVVARHSTERLTKVYGLNALARLIMSEDSGLIERIVAELAGRGAIAKFSRDDEREADQFGLRYLHEAGYPPDAMAAMFETLLEQRRERPNLLERFFATHPLTEERIAAVREQAQELPATGGGAGRGPAFQRLQQQAEAINARLASPS